MMQFVQGKNVDISGWIDGRLSANSQKISWRVVSTSLGLLAVTCLAKKATSLYARRQLQQMIDTRKERVQTQKKRYAEEYPSLTSAQARIVELDFPELREKLQSGELKAVDVIQAFYAKAVEVDKLTNAVTEFIDEALERAKELDAIPIEQRGPLHGMPFSLKEHIKVVGKDCTVGIPSNLEKISAKDAELVRCLKNLGAIPFCRTNLPQTCISFDCSNPIFGKTVNPRNSKRGPGGSSGGEGALIAGGGSIMGIGSDLGGSVRMPAIFCGITSLKPTSGRLPLSGQGSDGGLIGVVGLFNTLGFMAKSARGIEDCMKIFLNDERISQINLDARFIPLAWNENKARIGQKLRIGWYDYDGCFEATPGVKRAVTEAVNMLRMKGHELVPFCPRGLDKVNMLYGDLMTADEAKSTKAMLKDGPVDMESLGLWWSINRLPHWLRRALVPFVSLKSPICASLLCEESTESWQLWEQNNFRLGLIEDILEDWTKKDIDVVIGPGLAMPAQPPGYGAWELAAISYTCVYNLLNFPAGSMPITTENSADQAALDSYPGFERDSVYGWVKDGTKGAEGMSLNVQVIGKPWTEELVLRVMTELESMVEPKNIFGQ